VQVSVLGQPDKRGGAIGVELRDALGWPDARAAWFAVAWAKRSGLMLIEPELRAFRQGKRSLRALIGVDQHGGTIEGLRLALDLFTEARVYHDSNPRRTFHPKLYVVEASTRALAIVGSGNLTSGGLFGNHELSLSLDLDPRDRSDAAVLAELRSWFDARWSEKTASVRLSPTTIQALIDDPNVVVVPETWGPPRSASGPKGKKGSKGKSVFGPAVKDLAVPPKPANVEDVDRIDAVTGLPDLPGAPAADDHERVMAAGLPEDRWGQAGFNRAVAEEFFGASANGEKINAQAVERDGTVHSPKKRALIFPSTTNANHRFELPEPERRERPTTDFPLVLVREIGIRSFRYMYLMPGDVGYRAIRREIDRRPSVGISRKAETKRVYMTLGELRTRWPASPLGKN
jgi:HKD family nuclease